MEREKCVTASERHQNALTQVKKHYTKRAKKFDDVSIEANEPTATQPLFENIDVVPTTPVEDVVESNIGNSILAIEDVVESNMGNSILAIEDVCLEVGGPIDKTVLESFDKHIAHAIWNQTRVKFDIFY
jgi:hypothetical protein